MHAVAPRKINLVVPFLIIFIDRTMNPYVYSLLPRLSRKKYSTVAAARTALRAVRDSSHAFPPLQSAAAALLIVWDMSEVSFPFTIPENHSQIGISENKVEQGRLQAAGRASHKDCW
jgi:hypothetical protein